MMTMVMRRLLFVCASAAGTDVLGRLGRRTTGKKQFRWVGEGELQVPQQSAELWWHEFMCTPSTNTVDSISSVHNEDKSALHSREVGQTETKWEQKQTHQNHSVRESKHFKLIGFLKKK